MLWQANSTGPAILAREATAHGVTMVHISTEYIFDGTQDVHVEQAPSPPGRVRPVEGGDAAVASTPALHRAHLLESWDGLGEAS